jgi:cytochrome c556
VSISKFVITPFTFALINIPASGASLCTPTEPGVLSDVTETKDETATLLKTMQQALTDLQKEVKGLKSKQTLRDQNLRQCHACGKPGHELLLG